MNAKHKLIVIVILLALLVGFLWAIGPTRRAEVAQTAGQPMVALVDQEMAGLVLDGFDKHNPDRDPFCRVGWNS